MDLGKPDRGVRVPSASACTGASTAAANGWLGRTGAGASGGAGATTGACGKDSL